MAGPIYMVPCHQWTVALSQKRRMKCSITEASRCLHTLLGAQLYHGIGPVLGIS